MRRIFFEKIKKIFNLGSRKFHFPKCKIFFGKLIDDKFFIDIQAKANIFNKFFAD